jgi:hypothetical protein
MSVPRVGDVAPEVEWLRPDGSAAGLGEFRGKALALVFLRHLA